jgi:hypothetical protein
MWRYWWYADPKGPDPWRAWYDAQNASVQGRHDAVFRMLEARVNWTPPHAKKIGDDLDEIILKTNVQHRLLGFYWPHSIRMAFTFLLPCTHKGRVYDPKDAFEIAERQIEELKSGRNWIRRCDRPE